MEFMGKFYRLSDNEKATVIFNKLSNGEEVNWQVLDFYTMLNKEIFTQR